MKNSIKIMALLSVALVAESVLTIGHFRKYKSEIAHDKIRAIELLAKDNRSAAEERELDSLCHAWAVREMKAYKINRKHDSVTLAEYKADLAKQKSRAIELAAQEHRSEAEQKELRGLGHAWALREKAVYEAMHKGKKAHTEKNHKHMGTTKKVSYHKHIHMME